MGFDTDDLLRQAGFEEGAVLPVSALDTSEGSTASTTSTTFTNASLLLKDNLRFEVYRESDVELQARLFGRSRPGTGETYDIRVRDQLQGDTLVALSDITSNTRIDTGWQSVQSTDPTAASELIFQHRTNPGSNSSSSDTILLLLGVEL